jgi:hypothetical protein
MRLPSLFSRPEAARICRGSEFYVEKVCNPLWSIFNLKREKILISREEKTLERRGTKRKVNSARRLWFTSNSMGMIVKRVKWLDFSVNHMPQRLRYQGIIDVGSGES